jgi:hypothetical protein
MLCARCNTENPAGVRYCHSCGSPLAEQLNQPPGVVKPVPAPAAGAVGPLRWALAIVSGVLFLYNASFVIALGLLWFSNSSISIFQIGDFGFHAVLAGAGCCGLFLALADRKTALTAIVAGLLMRALLGLLFGLSTTPGTMAIGWLVICGASAFVLWWLWLDRPREPGDAARMSVALTVLVSAESLSAAYAYTTHPSRMRSRQMLILVIVIGSLLWLRIRIPAAIADAGERPQPVSGLGRDPG